MSEFSSNEPMLDMYIFETSQLIQQLETSIIENEKSSYYTPEAINEIFRIMHTIKGSSAMMLFNEIASLAHSVEDCFYYLRERRPENVDCTTLSDLVLECVDYIKIELQKIKNGDKADGDSSTLNSGIKEFLEVLKKQNPSDHEFVKPISNRKQNYYISSNRSSIYTAGNVFKATIFFEDDCEMENIRAFAVIHNIREFTEDVVFLPEDIIDNDDSIKTIREQGFVIHLKTNKSYEELHEFFMGTIFLKSLELIQQENDQEFVQYNKTNTATSDFNNIKIPMLQEKAGRSQVEREVQSSISQNIVSVNVGKLDKLMDLVGEMVIAEAMVTENPDLKGLSLDNFHKASRQLKKITSELQDMVMSIRMLPLSATFHKMHRVIRDMSKKLNKEVQLEIVGEDTEVDKNIIEHISDPLMHLVRNAIDHGIEEARDRELGGKQKAGKVILEAKNSGSDVLILVKDDGRGLNKEKILMRAKENELLSRPENEMTDKEIYNLIFLPGFSTKDGITEFSGRGVGMDVVTKNIETVGGSVSIESTEGFGSTITLKIPLTLAIVDGMNIRVGNSRYTIPTTAIKESFRPKESEIIKDPDGNEMIMVRGNCYPILRLHDIFKVTTEITNFERGILIMVEQDEKTICLFADCLLGQQQVVVKALPEYIRNIRKIHGLTGCTLLGDGSISLILDVSGIMNLN